VQNCERNVKRRNRQSRAKLFGTSVLKSRERLIFGTERGVRGVRIVRIVRTVRSVRIVRGVLGVRIVRIVLGVRIVRVVRKVQGSVAETLGVSFGAR
jgi:hypothetical protein